MTFRSGWKSAALVGLALVRLGLADTLSFSGFITQSTFDGTGPANNNPTLNTIMDGDPFLVTIISSSAITGPGLYTFPPLAVTFLDSAAAVTETAFDSASLSISADGSFFDLSLLGCLSTGSGCSQGNELDANFQILSSDLNSANVDAQAIPFLNPPVDLLEDDGVTDIQGSVDHFSNPAAVPEPTSVVLLAAVIVAIGALTWKNRRAVAGSW